jgi:hypothetical protein
MRQGKKSRSNDMEKGDTPLSYHATSWITWNFAGPPDLRTFLAPEGQKSQAIRNTGPEARQTRFKFWEGQLNL